MSVDTVVAKARQLLQDEPWEGTIGGAYTAGGTTVTITAYTEIEDGDILDFAEDTTYEQMRVAAEPSSSSVSVKYGHNNTTNANHNNGAVFLKNPTYGTQEIVDAITHVVDTRLWPDVFVTAVTTITPSPQSTNLYDLGSSFEDVIQVMQLAASGIEDVIPVRALPVWVPASVSSTNKALRVISWPRIDVDATVLYKAKATTSTMTDAMEPVIALGVAADLARTKALERTDRPDEDDRPGRYLRVARELDRMFDTEKQRLRHQLIMDFGPPRKRFWNSTRYYSSGTDL